MIMCGWNNCVPLLPVQGEKDIYTHKRKHKHSYTHTNTQIYMFFFLFCFFLIHTVTLKNTHKLLDNTARALLSDAHIWKTSNYFFFFSFSFFFFWLKKNKC